MLLYCYCIRLEQDKLKYFREIEFAITKPLVQFGFVGEGATYAVIMKENRCHADIEHFSWNQAVIEQNTTIW